MREYVFVALGSNLGDRAALLAQARHLLALVPVTRVVAASRIEETAPLGRLAQGPYLNQMVALVTGLAPHQLLLACRGIEQRLGRERRGRWAARTMDLDLVCFGERRLRAPDLCIPHPGIASRDFWRREISELDALLRAAA